MYCCIEGLKDSSIQDIYKLIMASQTKFVQIEDTNIAVHNITYFKIVNLMHGDHQLYIGVEKKELKFTGTKEDLMSFVAKIDPDYTYYEPDDSDSESIIE